VIDILDPLAKEPGAAGLCMSARLLGVPGVVPSVILLLFLWM